VRLRSWLRNGISYKPLMLHGTSLEALEILLNRGRMPPPKRRGYEGHYYFTPVTAHYRESPFAIKFPVRHTKSQARANARFYAELSGRKHFLARQLGQLPRWFYDCYDSVRSFKYCLVNETKPPLPPKEAAELVEQMMMRKGVIIETNERVFELQSQKGDDTKMLVIKCQKGLPYWCIQGVLPMDPVEIASCRKYV
jgi:hypothetical protein